MSMRGKLPLLFLLLAFLLATFAFATFDPYNKKDPEERLRECSDRCRTETQHGQEQWRCQERCDKDYRREKEKERDNRDTHREREQEQQKEEEEEGGSQGRSQGHPYVFEDQHFRSIIQTEHGRVRLLQKFTQRSKLLKGIENFRIGTLEADPQTFIVPNHLDAEGLFFVANGRGTISLIREDKRESFNLRCGDLVRVPAGTTIYLINRDNNEKLVLVKLLQPVSTPGEFEAFFGPGGQEQESFFRAFSIDLLEAAFNTDRSKVERIFKQQKEGVILKASQEQIRALSQKEEGGIWPFGGETKGVFNLFDQRPWRSNQYGKLYKVDPSEWRDLRQLDVSVSFANITQGSMVAPYYNTKATKIAIVTKGEGYFEMACPHVTSESRQGRRQEGGRQTKSSPSYQKVSSPLKQGVVYIVPAGHPIITIASQNQNLEVVIFDVNAQDNEKIPLAGKRNIFTQLEKEAKELAFGVKAREVDEVFQSQDEEFFFKGPRSQRQREAEEGRAFA